MGLLCALLAVSSVDATSFSGIGSSEGTEDVKSTLLPTLGPEDFRYSKAEHGHDFNFKPHSLEMSEIKHAPNASVKTQPPGFDYNTPHVELDDFIYELEGHTVRTP
jgi:hypothetical protein